MRFRLTVDFDLGCFGTGLIFWRIFVGVILSDTCCMRVLWEEAVETWKLTIELEVCCSVLDGSLLFEIEKKCSGILSGLKGKIPVDANPLTVVPKDAVLLQAVQLIDPSGIK